MDPKKGDEVHAPKHLVAPEPKSVDDGYDNWFVAMFQDLNRTSWERQPGDRLTFGQMVTICGQTLTMMVLISLPFILIGIFLWAVMSGELSFEDG